MMDSNRSLRLLLLVESASAGVGRHVLDLTRALLDRGHHVHLLYSPERADATFRARLDSLREHALLRASELPMHRGLHWRDLRAIFKIRKCLGRHGPFDVAHFHSSKAGLVGRLALAGSGIRRIYTPHALFTLGKHGLTRAAAAIGERLLSYLCETVILVSSAEYDHAVSIGLPADRLRIICPGVSSDFASSHFPGRDIRIGFVGRLVEQKSPEDLLRAFQILVQTKRNARLRIAGDGPLLLKLKAMAQRSKIADRIDWLGETDGAAAMRSFDIFALTSRYEGFPYVLLEAMSSGLPIVTTGVGGTAEAIVDGANGFVTAVGDYQAIARALAALVDDAGLRERMGAESRKRAGQFSLERMIEQTINSYCSDVTMPGMSTVPPVLEDLHKNVRG